MKLASIKCPECGAALERKEGRTQMFCEYCGAKVVFDDIAFFKEETKTARFNKVIDTAKELYYDHAEREEQSRKASEEKARSAMLQLCGIVAVLLAISILLTYIN